MATLSEGLLEVPESPRRPVAIEVRDLHKSFRIPTERMSTLKERAANRFRTRGYRTLRALAGISFDVEVGEFFGIVGRNGSGKSTLLKLLASIYRADSGSIRVAGRLAPFIELGVGFNPELTARENVTLNGVLMGLTPREATRRFDEVLDFAELGEFADLKLKNYSSGMMVRLGFSLMVQVDADVLLVDEVLAVGDAAFQLKCLDAFARLHQRGTTIVLVTHDTAVVQRHCDRALMIEDGEIELAGDPGDVSRRYLEVNFEHRDETRAPEDVKLDHRVAGAEFLDVWVQDRHGKRVTTLEQGAEIELHVRLRAVQRLGEPTFAAQIVNADGLPIVVPDSVEIAKGSELSPGETVHIVIRVDNRLAPGHYFVHCLAGTSEEGRVVAFRKYAADCVVFGTKPVIGVVDLESSSTLTREDGSSWR